MQQGRRRIQSAHVAVRNTVQTRCKRANWMFCALQGSVKHLS